MSTFFEEISLIMTILIAGLIFAFLLAVFAIIWITYCMFYKERHRRECYQYDISDLRQKNIQIAQKMELEQEKDKKESDVKLAAGVIILPSRRKQEDDYAQRPDYPEFSTGNIENGTKEMIDILNEVVEIPDIEYKKTDDTTCESGSLYHSEV